mgnify:CR=1 FL=1
MASLKLQVARIVPFDAMVGLVLTGILFLRFGPMGKKARRTGRWRLNAWSGWYMAMAALLGAGLISGVHAVSAKLWVIELLTFGYMLAMLLSVDLLSTRRLERFLEIGGWCFAAICIFSGLVVVIHLAGGPKFEYFYEDAWLRAGVTNKFTGPMRFSNQWAGYFLAMFPLLMALNFKYKSPWLRTVLLASLLLGFVTVPSTGSRSGMFLVVAQSGGFVVLYSLLNRQGRATTRLLSLAIFIGVLVGTYWFLFQSTGDDAIINRSLGAFDLVREQSVSDRWRDYNWAMAIREFEKSPFIGMGLGTFELFYDKHEVHSSYLSFAAETGVVGAAAYLFLMAVPMLALLRAMVATTAHGRTDAMLIALTVAVGTQLLFAIHHNNTRHRHVWMVLIMGLLYAELTMAKLRAMTAAARQERAAALAASIGRRRR